MWGSQYWLQPPFQAASLGVVAGTLYANKRLNLLIGVLRGSQRQSRPHSRDGNEYGSSVSRVVDLDPRVHHALHLQTDVSQGHFPFENGHERRAGPAEQLARRGELFCQMLLESDQHAIANLLAETGVDHLYAV